jgi:hypothetical protein
MAIDEPGLYGVRLGLRDPNGNERLSDNIIDLYYRPDVYFVAVNGNRDLTPPIQVETSSISLTYDIAGREVTVENYDLQLGQNIIDDVVATDDFGNSTLVDAIEVTYTEPPVVLAAFLDNENVIVFDDDDILILE